MRSSSFSRYFFDRIGGNQTMAEAFERTQQQMQRMATHRAQNPQIDVNGNAVANELLDLRALGQRRIPADISSLSLPPAFASQLAAQTISQGESPTLEVELVGGNLDQVLVEIVPPSFDANVIFQDWQQAEQRVKEVDLTAVESKSGQAKYQLKYDGFDQVGEYQLIFQASNLDGFATPMQSTVTVTEAATKPATKLTGDVKGDGVVNIFDLVIAAGSFGKTGVGIMGDVNGDGGVNIFDLVIVAGNFGQSLLAAPATAAKIDLSTDQKRHIATAIDQLVAKANRSTAQEMALSVLQAILPDRLPTQTQLLANYPNPFNPETWIPFQLSQENGVGPSNSRQLPPDRESNLLEWQDRDRGAGGFRYLLLPTASR